MSNQFCLFLKSRIFYQFKFDIDTFDKKNKDKFVCFFLGGGAGGRAYKDYTCQTLISLHIMSTFLPSDFWNKWPHFSVLCNWRSI